MSESTHKFPQTITSEVTHKACLTYPDVPSVPRTLSFVETVAGSPMSVVRDRIISETGFDHLGL